MTERDREKPVVLSTIYTRVGDDGTTALGDMSRVSKTDPRIAAYADVEEANAALGVALALGEIDADVRTVLARIQNELFDVGADLCTPVAETDGASEFTPLRVETAYVERLEAECDRFNEGLSTLRSFILPGGTPAAALLHTARVTVRRAERSAWSAAEAHGDTVSPLPARYLNRLSDLLFILCRRANHGGGDVLWQPGGQR
ncbi:cob(I)yrinic acid a,c-diamide adenosyltransferase [Salinactinospora qingdaonensis]|uniref:Corrinoid adenosyltransferase n=1 Tax=Salinactinospora qingdaonensis TaxID=702744 RepID=A0ABP7FR02_9ACTN